MTEGDRVTIRAASRWGMHELTVSLQTGEGRIRRRVSRLDFDETHELHVSDADLARLRETAATVCREDQDLATGDPIHAIGEEKVCVILGDRRVQVHDPYGRLTMPGAGDLARLGEELADKHLPLPRDL